MSEQQLQALATEINQCSGFINECKEKISNYQRNADKLSLDLQMMKETEPKMRMEVESREKSIEELKKSIESQEKVIQECTPDKSEIKRLSNRD